MKKLSSILALVIVVCVVFSMSAFAADVTWKDYQDYLIEAAGGNAPDLDEFKGQVEAIGSWDEMPLDQSPWDQFFTTLGLSTWDEFVAAGGVGKQSLVSGTASGEASGEASEDPYPMFEEYKEYLLETLLQDEFMKASEDAIREALAAAETPDDENIQRFTGTAEVDQAPPGVEFPLSYDEWYAAAASGEPSGEAGGAPSGEAS